MITEDYVSFEIAKLLKEKGFDEPCYLGYNKNEDYIPTANRRNSQIIQPDYCLFCCPTLQITMKWLREVHNIYISISHRFSHNADNDIPFSWYINTDLDADGEYVTYEEACEAAIKCCLENLI